MRVLLTGGTGLLGWSLLRQMPEDWQVYVATHRNPHLPRLGPNIHPIHLDLTVEEEIYAAVARAEPDAVIHTASIGNLDSGEKGKDEAWRVNVLGTQHLLTACRPSTPHITVCSTLYVFDGTSPPYTEASTPHPLNYYGKTKLAGEAVAQELASRLLLLRLNTIYGWHLPGQRMNWVTWILSKLQVGEAVKAVDDIFNNLIWVDDAARAILNGVVHDVTGLYNIGGPETLSRYEFSLKIADVFGFDRELIAPISDDAFANMVPRPKNTTCTIDKMVRDLDIQPRAALEGLIAMRQTQPVYAQEGQ